jgi:hypothetical protein
MIKRTIQTEAGSMDIEVEVKGDRVIFRVFRDDIDYDHPSNQHLNFDDAHLIENTVPVEEGLYFTFGVWESNNLGSGWDFPRDKGKNPGHRIYIFVTSKHHLTGEDVAAASVSTTPSFRFTMTEEKLAKAIDDWCCKFTPFKTLRPELLGTPVNGGYWR